MKIRTKPAAAPLFQLMDALEGRRMFAFGLTTTATTYVVDTGGGVVFTILKNGATVSSTIHLGDMTSVKYNGAELLASYAQSSRYSHYEQGLGSIATISATIDPAATPQWIKITCDDSAEATGGVIHYYVAKRGDPNIYMASLPTDVNNGPGEGRYIAYLDRTKFTPEAASDNTGSTGAIEGSDVFGHADGTTTSKFFNNGRRMIENTIHGVVGTGVGAFMTMGNREHSAGGPFFKDIDFQSSETQIEMYNCVFTGHTQTEAFRQGLQGPYAMMFTTGATPALPNYTFLEGVGIQGLIPAAQRGSISGVATGMVTGHETVVGLSNTTAQYWGYANTATGSYSITGVQPGTYTETLYDNELEVGTRTVTVSAGVNTSANIANTYYTPPAPIFRIGTWDGTPLGFLNADKIETEHPSDIRMSDWNSTPNFVVGTNTDAQWPLAQFMGVNNSQRITFNLTAAQVQSMSLRIGITWGFSGARPKVTVNSGQTYAWTSANPSASSDLNSRGITRGTWRGDNQLYTFSIPSTAFRAGTNTIDVPLISGSFTAGQTWLSPNVAYDAIDLVPSTATAPAIASVTITPSGSTTGVNGTKTFTAVAKDANGNVITANIDWSAARGTIDANGNYVAPATAGSDTITATANTTKTPGYNTTSSSTSAFTGTITGSGSTTISVLSATPSVVTAASASPSPVYGKTTTLSALGTDLTGESNLTYTWSVLGTPPAAVTFSAANGTNAGKSTLATFTQPGDYTFRVTITNGSNLSATSDVTVTVFDKKVWYKVDASSGTTLTDSSGSNNTATLTGSYAYAAGVDGNAIKFTGGSASLPTGVVSTLNDFTIGAWIKPDASQSWSRVFDFGTGTTAYMFFTPRTSTGVSRFAIKSATGSEQTIDGPALAVGAWTHVAVTLSGNLATLYINGVAVGTNAGLTTHPAALGNTANNYLGKSQFAADPALLASVDDFRLYGSGLSASAISTWYSAAGTPATVTGFTTDDGSSQRSMVRSFTLTFDKAVTLPAGALTLLVNGVASPASLIVTATSSANTQYLVTFSNTGAAGGSLADGSYQLTLNGALITSGAGRPMASNSNYTFYRLFGDSDGNGVVDFNDFLNLQNSFGQSVGSPTFAASLDGDGNGTVDFNDFLMLQNNFGKTMTAARPIVVAVKKTTPVKLVRR